MEKKKKKKNGTWSTVLLVLIFIAGLSFLLYPSFSNYWNSMHATKAISDYHAAVAQLENDDFEKLWAEAVQYNADLNDRLNVYVLDDEMRERYNNILNVGGSGVMGYIDIESIGVSLPIYHGTEAGVLQVAVGHLDWTSVPVGGESTHTVLSGHRGLPSAKLFTDLDKLREGENFSLTVLDQTLTYEIDQIRIVLPDEAEDLLVESGKDYCTLITCTPYGINTHRLLVRGHRVDTGAASSVHIVSEAIIIEPLLVAPVLAVPMLILLFIFGLILPSRKNKKKDDKGNEETPAGVKETVPEALAEEPVDLSPESVFDFSFFEEDVPSPEKLQEYREEAYEVKVKDKN